MANEFNNKKIGEIGEDLAVKFLKKRGFYIISRNYLKSWGEIDIVAREKPAFVFGRFFRRIFKKEFKKALKNISREMYTIHFFEVKTTVTHEKISKIKNNIVAREMDPASRVNEKKLRNIINVAKTYMLENDLCLYQVHLVSVFMNLNDKTAFCELFYNIDR